MIQAYPTVQISHNDVGVVTVAIDAPPMKLIGPELVRRPVPGRAGRP